jgi:transformation/transcription domain-associated protein
MQSLPTYSQLVDYAIERFFKVLTDTEPQFLSESGLFQLRKKSLELIQRTTSILNNNYLNVPERTEFIKQNLLILYRLLDKENEENVIICLKIITDYHRLLKPHVTNQVIYLLKTYFENEKKKKLKKIG